MASTKPIAAKSGSTGARPVSMRTTRDAIGAGIGMVHQHFILIEPFTVLENVMLGAEGGPRLAPGARAARAAQARRDTLCQTTSC